jgi:phage tail-like protein
MAALGKLGVRTDPIPSFNFLVTLIDTSSKMALAKSIALGAIGDVAAGGFSECTGLEMSLEVEEYKEGGHNGAVLQFPTRVKWGHITLKKGVGAGTTLWDWHYGFAEGRGKRRDGIIILQTELHLPNNIWYFRRGLPVKYTGPAMNASQSSTAIESIEISHEGILQVPGVGFGAAAASFGIGLAVT